MSVFPFDPFPVPPAGGTGYPSAGDVTIALAGAGVDGITSGEITRHLRTAISEWEKRTHYTPFLADLAPNTRTFRADEWGVKIVDFRTGLVECISVTTTFGDILTLGDDYTLLPRNAPSIGEPYTYIEFNRRAGGIFSVSGRWGYCDELPADVSEAIIARVLSLCAEPQIRAIATSAANAGTPGGRLKRVTEGDVTREWSESQSVTERRAIFEQWGSTWEDAVKRYKMETLV